MGDTRDRPVITGLVALVGVAVVVGLLTGLAALVGTRIVGLGGESDSVGGRAARGAVAVPARPGPHRGGGRAPRHAGGHPEPAGRGGGAPPTSPRSRSRRRPINLAAGATAVSGEEQLYLSGTYPGGEGSILDIEYKINDQPWREFNLDVNVSGQTFATYVYTSNAGTIKWRMWDKSRNKRSNEVTVKHG